MMRAVLTGDIVNSSKANPKIWLNVLQDSLSAFGQRPADWDIFRGDSCQLLLDDPLDALTTAIRLKAAIKSLSQLDIRIAIGIGLVDHHADKVTDSNGTAFQYSGAEFEQLAPQKTTLRIRTPWADFNEAFNLLFQLGAVIMDNWSEVSAIAVAATLAYPEKTQQEIGTMLHIQQNAVSRRLKRACFEEIKSLTAFYRTRLAARL